MSTCEQSNKCKYRMNIKSKRESTRSIEVQPQRVVHVLPRPPQDLFSLFAINYYNVGADFQSA